MPEFTTPFSGMNAPRKLSQDELIRAIRFSIAAEYEAVQLYMQLHDSIDDKLAKKVLLDISNEEREHAGEFMHLLRQLDPEEDEFYNNGAEEVEEMMKDM